MYISTILLYKYSSYRVVLVLFYFLYNLAAIKTPIALLHGEYDVLGTPTDVSWLID